MNNVVIKRRPEVWNDLELGCVGRDRLRALEGSNCPLSCLTNKHLHSDDCLMKNKAKGLRRPTAEWKLLATERFQVSDQSNVKGIDCSSTFCYRCKLGGLKGIVNKQWSQR